MAIDKQESGKNREMQTRLLPKNFRQIGDPGTKKIYMEDYVYTYLNKLAQPGNLYARGAILFGKVYNTAVGNCLFISGAAACQNFEFDLEETVFSEEVWGEVYRIRDKFFTGLEIAGWFLSRMGFSVELNDKIIRMHMDNFSGENKVLYMMDVLENEDAFYQLENYSLKRQRGYYLYYETNKEMKEYMLAEGESENEAETKRKSATILRDSSVVKNYKKAMKKKKNIRSKSVGKFTPSALAGGLVMFAVVLYGASSIYRFRHQETNQAVFNQQETKVWEKASTEEVTEEQNETETAATSASSSEASTEMISWNQDSAQESTNRQTEASTENGEVSEEAQSNQTDSTGNITEANQNPESSSTQEDVDVFTQEEPDDVMETWNYIGGQYTVQQGDTLAAISKKIYQSYEYIQLIAETNGIDDVDHIYPGQVLDIPEIED